MQRVHYASNGWRTLPVKTLKCSLRVHGPSRFAEISAGFAGQSTFFVKGSRAAMAGYATGTRSSVGSFKFMPVVPGEFDDVFDRNCRATFPRSLPLVPLSDSVCVHKRKA